MRRWCDENHCQLDQRHCQRLPIATLAHRLQLWTAAGGRHYAGKPHPVLIVQDNRFDATASITVCPLTTDPTDIPLLRIALDPTEANGLAEASRIMLDKVTTMPRAKLGDRIGSCPVPTWPPFREAWWFSSA